MFENDPGYAMWQAHNAARGRSKDTYNNRETRLIRFESDNQGGGCFRRYTPGITKCPLCDEAIDANGDCAKGYYANGDDCGGHG
jgi:hypothetical protein